MARSNYDIMHFYVFLNTVHEQWRKCADVLCIPIKKLENKFQDFPKCLFFFLIFANPFSIITNALLANFQMEKVSDCNSMQLKEKFGHVFLPDFCKPYLTREKYPLLMSHTLGHCFLAIYAFMNNYCQGRSTEKVIFHKKYLTNILNIH